MHEYTTLIDVALKATRVTTDRGKQVGPITVRAHFPGGQLSEVRPSVGEGATLQVAAQRAVRDLLERHKAVLRV